MMAVGALAAFLAAACGDDTSANGDGGTDTDTDIDSDTDVDADTDTDCGIDTEGHEFAIDGDCDPNTLVGAFEVASRDTGTFQYAVVGGSIADAVNWNTTALLHQDEGACKLYEFSLWSCSPACEGGEICNDESECVPFPANLDWGTVRVDGLVKCVEMSPDTSFNYQYQDIDNPPFTAGERIVLWAEGGDGTEEVLLDGMGVTPLEVENKDYIMYEDKNTPDADGFLPLRHETAFLRHGDNRDLDARVQEFARRHHQAAILSELRRVRHGLADGGVLRVALEQVNVLVTMLQV